MSSAARNAERKRSGFGVNPQNLSPTCGACHKSEQDQLSLGVHNASASNKGKTLPNCRSCHLGDIHTMLPAKSEGSPVGTIQQVQGCAIAVATPMHSRRYRAASTGEV